MNKIQTFMPPYILTSFVVFIFTTITTTLIPPLLRAEEKNIPALHEDARQKNIKGSLVLKNLGREIQTQSPHSTIIPGQSGDPGQPGQPQAQTGHIFEGPEIQDVPAHGLSDILHVVQTYNGQIREADQEIAIARKQLEQAHAAAWPRGNFFIVGAPMFAERGNALYSAPDLSNWGAIAIGGLQVFQPLFTFGQLSGYQRAATEQIDAKSHLKQAKTLEIIATAKEFYYSYLMANALSELVDDLIEYLKEAIDTADKQNKKKEGSIDPHDVAKLKVAFLDLKQKREFAIQGTKTAEEATLWISGGAFRHIPASLPEPAHYTKKSLDEYISMAQRYRPELKAISSGINAYQALASAKEAQSIPTIFLGAYGTLALCSVCTPQPSIFAFDPFNRILGGGGIGLYFDIEYKRHSAEAAVEHAQAMKLAATQTYAEPGIILQVKKAYWDVEAQEKSLEIARERKLTARKWFVSNTMGWSVGLTTAKDLLESLEGNGLSRKNYIETITNFNLALSRLSQALGYEITDLVY